MRRDIHRARQLRDSATEAELHLWMQLRGKQMAGHRFRRQVPIGPYVVDFACLRARLVIEVDGGQHADTIQRDQLRTTWLESQGFRVLRFWDDEVLHSTEEALSRILAALSA